MPFTIYLSRLNVYIIFSKIVCFYTYAEKKSRYNLLKNSRASVENPQN